MYIYGKKNRKRKSMEIATFKEKSCNLPVLPFGHSNLNILSYKSPIDANSILLDSWLEDLLAYQMLAEKKLIWERYEFSKMPYEFCKQIGFVKKQVHITSQSIQTGTKFLFQQFNFYKSKVKVWAFYSRLFLLF